MAKQLELEVANFVCRFGDKLVLNDLLSEIVIPSFFADTTRSSRGTQYFFIDQELRYLEDENVESLALCCRFVKNTTLKRHQIYSPSKGIVSDERSMDSAPTSLAVLLLYSHRLLFVKEVPNAPTMQQFGTTFKYRMRDAVLDFHSSQLDQRVRAGEKITKKAIAEQFPIPDVSVTPITSKEALKTFIERFEVLTTLKIELAPTNNELDNEEFFEDTREAKEQVGSSKTTLTHHHSKGLDKKGVLEHVEAAKQGNLQVEMRGKDKNGDDLKGDNEDFSVKATLGTSQVSFDEGVQKSYSRYNDLKAAKIVTEGQQQHDYAEKLREAFNLL